MALLGTNSIKSLRVGAHRCTTDRPRHTRPAQLAVAAVVVVSASARPKCLSKLTSIVGILAKYFY